MMAFSGVRSSWLIWARNSDLARAALLGQLLGLAQFPFGGDAVGDVADGAHAADHLVVQMAGHDRALEDAAVDQLNQLRARPHRPPGWPGRRAPGLPRGARRSGC